MDGEPGAAAAHSSQGSFTEEEFVESGKCLCGLKKDKKVSKKVAYAEKISKGKRCA